MPNNQKVAIPVAGVADSTKTALAPGASWISKKVPYVGNEAVLFAMQSDVGGSYNVEYYDGEEKVNFMGNTTQYTPSADLQSFQGALHGKANAFRLVYTNGSIAQTQFYCEIRFTTQVQPTLRAVGVPMSSTNLATTAHTTIEGRENGTGAYKQATTTQTGDKVGMDVNIINPSAATDTSALAKESTLQSISDKIPTKGQKAASGSQSVVLASDAALPLPTGAATATKQDTGNTSLSNIDADLGTLTDPAVTDPTASASVIALLKGIVRELVAPSSTQTGTTVSVTTTGGQILAANANRKKVVIFNAGSGSIGISYVSATGQRVSRLITNNMWEMPEPIHLGAIFARSESGTASVEITETV